MESGVFPSDREHSLLTAVRKILRSLTGRFVDLSEEQAEEPFTYVVREVKDVHRQRGRFVEMEVTSGRYKGRKAVVGVMPPNEAYFRGEQDHTNEVSDGTV